MERPSKAFKRVRKQREDEFIPPGQPDRSYQRRFTKTKMSWPLALWYAKRLDVLAAVTIFIGLIIAGVGYILYLCLKWFLAHFGVLI